MLPRYCFSLQGMTPADETPCPEWDRDEQWVKAADVEALERRVKWLEEGREFQEHEPGCAHSPISECWDQPCTCTFLMWLAAEPKGDVTWTL